MYITESPLYTICFFILFSLCLLSALKAIDFHVHNCDVCWFACSVA